MKRTSAGLTIGIIGCLCLTATLPQSRERASAPTRFQHAVEADSVSVTPVAHASAEPTEEILEEAQLTAHRSPLTALLPVVDQDDIREEDKQILNDVLMWMPALCRDNLKHLVIRYDPKAPRAQASKSAILIRGGLPREELIAVLIHECGHIMDLGGLEGTRDAGISPYPDGNDQAYFNDPSIIFYGISWETSSKRREGATKQDFVSGYAYSDPWEDFSESLLLYALHNKEFVNLAETNVALAKKYAFLKQHVFGAAFELPESVSHNLAERRRVWDITKLSHNLHL